MAANEKHIYILGILDERLGKSRAVMMMVFRSSSLESLLSKRLNVCVSVCMCLLLYLYIICVYVVRILLSSHTQHLSMMLRCCDDDDNDVMADGQLWCADAETAK